MTRRHILLACSLVVAACGDDGPSNITPDAPGGGDAGGACLAFAGEIASYPGMYQGTTLGGGADLTAPQGSCATETGGQWYDPVGDDVVIRLAGLTPGSTYLVQLTTDDDLSFYVTTSCPSMSGAVTGCLVFTDESYTAEAGTFVATASEHFLVIDASNDPEPPPTGTFTVNVAEAACTPDTEATDCAAPTPFCIDYTCVQCASSFDCSSATPSCSAEGACVAGPMTCTGDDANDTTAPGDDGPTAATMIAAPAVGTPTVINGGICNSPAGLEQDWYTVDLPANDIGIELTFDGATNDLDVYLLTSAGQVVVKGESNAGIDELIRTTGLTAGSYYVVVTQYAPDGTTAAVPYTLTLRRTECDDDFGCTLPAAPVCGGSGVCGAGPAQCVGDDAGEATGNDGPAGATLLVSGVAATGSVCSAPASEADYYKVVVTNTQGMTVSLSWTGTDDLDPMVLDSTGAVMGFSFYQNPENVALTYLPAGTYYIKVTKFAQPSTAVTAYSITATVTNGVSCTSNADCAAEYETQVYRGDCTSAGVCQFLAPGTRANGAACDSPDDCMSGRCSYISFDADAQDSVCTTTCTASADCAAVGTGLTCTSGLQTNFCVPSCASDVECGANVGSATLTTGQIWDYLTCTASTGVCSI